MRSMTGAVIVGSLILMIALAIYLRVQPPEELPAAPAARSAQGEKTYSGRVADRLSQLRADYEREQAETSRPEAQKRELPDFEESSSTSDASLADLQKWRETALNDPDPEERAAAIVLLAGEEDPETFDVITEAMRDSDADVRLVAVEALGDTFDEVYPGMLKSALRDRDPDVRFEAVSILGDMKSPEALELVWESLNDPDEDVRSLAEGIIELAKPAKRRQRLQDFWR